jgi:uncharacterized protein DUF3105
VSKSSRRRQRPGTQPPANRAGGQPPASRPSASTPGGSSAASGGRPSSSNPGGTSAAASGAAAASAAASPAAASTSATTRTVAGSTRSSGGTRPRHGRRERQRVTYQRPSFLERYRAALIVGGALIGVAVIAAFVFVSAAAPAYACSSIWSPSPTASPSPGQTPNLGYAQPDMGHVHVGVGDKVTYTYCAPASGSHINKPGVAGPIPARVYGPSDSVIPQNWIHNLEHGGLVVLYKGDSAGATADGQAAFKSWQSAFPPVQDCGPVVARFDQMSTPFQAMVWGRVLMMDTWDPNLVNQFWQQWGGKTNLEPLCPTPNASAAPSGSVAPSGTPVPSASPAASDSAAPSAAPSAAASPNPSASPS